jgi:AraC-like DNA-binding protein
MLNPLRGTKHFFVEREPPPDDLACLVETFWSVRWDLEGREPFEQEVLPYPCVNVSFGAGGFEVHGPGTRRFVARLSGRGRIYGTKFTPAGFFAFARTPMRALVDRVVSVNEATGTRPPAPKNDDPTSVRASVEALLRGFRASVDERVGIVNHLVMVAQDDRGIRRAEDLARVAGISVRSLHRLFERYVGVGPKWIVRRSRVQEAAERVARGERVTWSHVAQELGYHDQSHLIRDFRAQVGWPPEAYARRCAESATFHVATARASRSAR